MELEEMQSRWKQLDEKIERTLKLESELLRISIAQPAKRRMQWASVGPPSISFFAFSGQSLWNVLGSIGKSGAWSTRLSFSLQRRWFFRSIPSFIFRRCPKWIGADLFRRSSEPYSRSLGSRSTVEVDPVDGTLDRILHVHLGLAGAVRSWSGANSNPREDRCTWILCNYGFGLIFPFVGPAPTLFGDEVSRQGWWLSLINSLWAPACRRLARKSIDGESLS